MIPWPIHCDFTTKGTLSLLNEALCVWECVCTMVDVFFEYQRHTWLIVCKVKCNYMLYLSNTWKERNTNPLRKYSYYLGSTLLYGSCFLGLVWHYGLTSSAYNVACFLSPIMVWHRLLCFCIVCCSGIRQNENTWGAGRFIRAPAVHCVWQCL